MKKLNIVAVVSLVLAAFLPVGVARAGDQPTGCAGGWNTGSSKRTSGFGECRFILDGTPIYFYGQASSLEGATASIRVWLHPTGNPEATLTNECTASGQGEASCMKDDAIFPREITPGLFELRLPPNRNESRLSMECNWSWKGSGAGEAGCFGAPHCEAAYDLSCQKVLGERVDCLLGVTVCDDPE
jgi:hypothetical protein